MSATQEQEKVGVTVLRKNVLVKPLDLPEFAGSIYLPPVARRPDGQGWFGQVVAVGREANEAETDIVVGVPVLFHAFRGQEVYIERVMFLLLDVDDVLAIVTGVDDEPPE